MLSEILDLITLTEEYSCFFEPRVNLDIVENTLAVATTLSDFCYCCQRVCGEEWLL